MKKLFATLAAILLLCSCSAQEPEKEIIKGVDYPPDLVAEYEGISIKASAGSYCWDNGEETICAEADHSIQRDNIPALTAGTEKTAKLIFGDGFVSCKIERWKVKKGYLEEEFGGYEFGTEGEEVPLKDGVFEIQQDGGTYVYNVHVTYENGDCHYGFRINSADPWGITFSIKNVTSTGADLVFCHSGENTDDEFMTVSYYSLEKDGKELPYIFEGEAAWTAEVYLLSPGDEIRTHIEWKGLYGTLEPGRYRIVKSFSNYSEPGDLLKVYYAEFVIE